MYFIEMIYFFVIKLDFKEKNEDLKLSGVEIQIPFGSGIWGTFFQNTKTKQR